MAKALSSETIAALDAVTVDNLAALVARARGIGLVAEALAQGGQFARDLKAHNDAELEALRHRNLELTAGGEYRYSL